MFYIESNGFSATTFLANALSSIAGMHSYHGTRSIPNAQALGSKDDLSAVAFVDKMLELEEQENKVIGAIHSKFNIDISQSLLQHSAPYAVAVRAPVSRIRSCHGWARGKFERGQFFQFSTNVLGLAYQIGGLEVSFDDLLFAFAALHIIEFDVGIHKNLSKFDKVYQMERYTTDKNYFKEMAVYLSAGRCVPSEDELEAIFSAENKVNSHTGKDFVSEEGCLPSFPKVSKPCW
ncbi:hypothetical protein [Oceanicoccus sp. KOV_DT_Chl]|uniref:hypothetical protein n=1 Tax=Oceanicoccus sp. KOV_DT_Chl TaxID=1904639 RepID=UPI000C7C6D24|nr:hypothetical protein [Oceanicoccus sp. KOV_DT_Chl]